MDDDLPLKKTGGAFPRNLDQLSITELEEYIVALNDEIARVRADIGRKKASRDAASSIFK